MISSRVRFLLMRALADVGGEGRVVFGRGGSPAVGPTGIGISYDLRITRVLPCVAREFKARASFMFAGCW